MSESEISTTEARWRNYQKLIWTQQQIHLQIQQQQQQQQFQNQKMNGLESDHDSPPALLHHPQGLQTEMQSEKPMDEPLTKDTTDPWENFDAQAAFLGPTLWDKRLPYDGQDFKLEYVDLEEFLTENGIPMEQNPHGNGSQSLSRNQQQQQHGRDEGHGNGGSTDLNNGCLPPPVSSETQMMAGPSRLPIHNGGGSNHLRAAMGHQGGHRSRSPSPTGSASSGISHDMGSDTSPDSSQHPGHDFDPRTRAFTEDELKPQPMIKKSRKQFVPDEAKDNKYWARRRKNNMAAKRSRDARRVKENQIAMRACYLEKENQALKSEIERIQKENILLKEQLRCCRRDH